MEKSNKNKTSLESIATKLNTLHELEENGNPVEQRTNQIEELFSLKVKDHEKKYKLSHLDPNLIHSPSIGRSPSQSSQYKKKGKKKHSDKSSIKSYGSSLRSASSLTEELNDDNLSIITSINERASTRAESVKDYILENGEIDYDKLVPKQCGDLTKINFVNDVEKYLVIRLYSNVSKLNTIINEMDSIHLKHYLETPDENDCLPLYYAVKADCINTVKLLIDKGCSLAKTTSAGDPATHLACLLGVSIELIEFLLSYDTQISLYKNDQEGWTLLHCACNQGHLDIVKYLLEKKHMNPNVKDGKNRFTGIQLAAMNNRIEVVEYFLSFLSLASIGKKEEIKKPTPSESKLSSRLVATSNINFLGSKGISGEQSISGSVSKIKPNLSKASFGSNNLSLSRKLSIQSSKPSTSLYKSRKSKLNAISLSQISVISENVNNDQNLNKIRPKISIESMTVYSAENKSKSEAVNVYKNFIIDLNSQNSEGQNVLHIASRYGRYDVVNMLLKKYGSNQLNVNAIDFKGNTCMDLAWNWLVNLDNRDTNSQAQSSNNNEFINDSSNYEKTVVFYDKESSLYIQSNHLVVNKQIDTEIKLIHLLSQYGAKFSTHKVLLYNLEYLNELDEKDVNLPSNMFYPHDYVSFKNIRLQNVNLIPIMTYLKCIIYVLKLNLPSMFLSSYYTTFNSNESIKAIGPASSTSINLSSSSLVDNQPKENTIYAIKQDMATNFHNLIQFIKFNVIDSFEKQIYFSHIETAYELLSKFQ